VLTCASCGQENPDGFRFCGACAAPLEAPGSAPREERKVVTVLFCDLVGFTSRSERLDPEEVRAIQAPYFARVRSQIESFGGTVEKFIGDAVMAVFGAPVAYEDDPERAVRAALAIRDWIRDEAGDLQVRVAVNTGEALVALGSRPAEGEGIVSGDVVNTAARLQSAAPPDGVLVGETTYRATRAAIDYREHAPVLAKGKAEHVPAWEAVEARSRFGVDFRQIGGAPLVGRVEELDLLTRTLDRVRRENEPQLVTIVGVPGIGKSRLVYELFRHVDAAPELTSWRQGRSLPYGEGVAFWALSEMVKAQAGILETDDAETTGRKLTESVFAVVADASEAAWILKNLQPLVGLETDVVGGEDRSEFFAAWRRFLETLAEARPLVLVFEDLHWADESLLDFLDHLVEWATGVPILVLGTARPELFVRQPGWGGGKPNAATLTLSPLSEEETSELVAAMVDETSLPDEQRQALLEQAGGNPLYAEEFVRLAAESGNGDLQLPESIQGLIAARLDALAPDEKALVQDASVVGKVFWLGALTAIGGSERWTLEQRLHQLERRELIRRDRRSSVAGENEYAFRHILVRDVAYGQIPRTLRAEKHLQAAEWIEGMGRSEDHAEMLAHHYLEALELARATGGDVGTGAERARATLRDAGDRAFALGAFPAAARYLEAALDLWPENHQERPYLLLRLGRALRTISGEGEDVLREAQTGLIAAGDRAAAAEAAIFLADLAWFSVDVEGAAQGVEMAEALIADEPASPTKAYVLATIARFHMRSGKSDAAAKVGQRALEIARSLGEEKLEAVALIALGPSRAHLGDVEGGIADLKRAIAIGTATRWERTPGAYNNLASITAMAGDLREAAALNAQGEAHARNLGVGFMVDWFRAGRSYDAYTLGDWERALELVETFLSATGSAAAQVTDLVLRVRARIRFASGDVSRAEDDVHEQLEIARRIGDPQTVVPALAIKARFALEQGRSDEASSLADEILSVAGNWGYASGESEWQDTAVVLHGVGRRGDLLASIARAPSTKWTRAASLWAHDDFSAAAETLFEIGALPDEAYARVRAAEELVRVGRQPEAEEQLERALAFYRSVGARRYVREAEALVAAPASVSERTSTNQ
jgi:class 3 adenylate cyclase/tetratricopeptide (TPR) repeat protein